MELENRTRNIAILLLLLLAVMAAAYFFARGTKKSGSLKPPAESPNQAVSMNPAIPGNVKHVVVVMEENTPYDKVIGNTRDMPYLNSLANTNAYAKNYFASTHPSIGNYFMLTAGNIITNNDNSSAVVSDDNIVRELNAAGKTWKEYSENLPSVGYDGGDQDPFEEHHNPLSYFSDVRNNQEQRNNLVPFSQLNSDIANHNLPNYSFIVPNNFNDAHDCPLTGSCNNLATADQWLSRNIQPLIESPDFSSPGGGLLIIIFDEASKSDHTHGGGQVAWVAVGPDVKKGYTSDTFFQHENTLRFVCDLLGLTSCPGKAAGAASMGEFLEGN